MNLTKKVLAFSIIFFLPIHVYAAGQKTQLTIQSHCSIAFVHLGSKLPSYIGEAILQARLFNTTEDIYLFANKKALNKKKVRHLVAHIRNDLQAKIVPIETLQKSEEHRIFARRSTLDKKFRHGFWRFATERFLILDDFMQQYNITNLVHLESDTLLYRKVEELMPTFKTHYKGIAAVFINEEYCIPCFIYINDKESLKKLAQYIAQEADTGKNDMFLLSDFRIKNHAQQIDTLPIISRAYIAQYGLKALNGRSTNNPEKYCNNIEGFNSIFDGNAIGHYFGGVDPRNGAEAFGPGYVNENNLFNTSLLTFRWKMDELGRKIPFMSFNGEEYRINNLHIHSKNLKNFLSVQNIN